jgi:rhodanese-related sulfurtransferase
MKKFQSLLLAMIFMGFVGSAIAADSPVSIEGAKSVDAAQAKALFDKGALFVDVRSDKDWAAGRMPDAVHLELKKVFTEESLGKVAKKTDPIVIYCNGASCDRSSKATASAVGWGYTNVHYYRLGFPDWKSAGYPTE